MKKLKKSSASDRNVPVLCKSVGYHNVGSSQRHSIGTGKSKKHNNDKSENFPKLCGITPRYESHVK